MVLHGTRSIILVPNAFRKERFSPIVQLQSVVVLQKSCLSLPFSFQRRWMGDRKIFVLLAFVVQSLFLGFQNASQPRLFDLKMEQTEKERYAEKTRQEHVCEIIFFLICWDFHLFFYTFEVSEHVFCNIFEQFYCRVSVTRLQRGRTSTLTSFNFGNVFFSNCLLWHKGKENLKRTRPLEVPAEQYRLKSKKSREMRCCDRFRLFRDDSTQLEKLPQNYFSRHCLDFCTYHMFWMLFSLIDTVTTP